MSTNPLDAAVRAAEEAIEDPNRYAKYEDVARCIMCAALPAEPTPEAMEVLIGAMYEWQDRDMLGDAERAYRALRAHLLGEDDITEDRRPWDEYAGEDA